LRRAGRIDDAADAAADAEALISSEDRWLALLAYESAVRLLQDLRDNHRTLGNRSAAVISGLTLAEFEHALGKTERAVVILRETLADLQTCALVALDRFAEAGATAREQLRRYGSDANHIGLVTFALEHLAHVLALEGDHARAARPRLRARICRESDANAARRPPHRAPPRQRAHSPRDSRAAMRIEEAVALALAALEEPPDGAQATSARL